MAIVIKMPRRALLGLLLCALLVPAAPAAAEPRPYGHDCTPRAGVRFCPTTSLEQRVPTWDGVPIDADVTLPPTGDGPFPLIAMLHGFGESKTSYEAATEDGDGAQTYRYNNVFFARRGYAVLNYSSRGFGDSCGRPASRTSPGCDRGWWHLADQRYEVRDAQYLMGELVDQGIADPGALGATGISFGGGQSMQLAFLRNRTRLPNGMLVPWRTRAGRTLELRAAAPRFGWSDLGYALVPNGRLLDFEVPASDISVDPIGMPVKAFLDPLIVLGSSTGFAPPRGADPANDPIGWNDALNAGEPYRGRVRDAIAQGSRYSGILGLGRSAAPLLIMNGWNDDLFPPIQALAAYQLLQSRSANANVALQIGDVGHSRGTNRPEDYRLFNDQGARFFDYWLRRQGANPLRPGAVTVMPTTCPRDAAAGRPVQAPSWRRLPGSLLVVRGKGTRRVDSAGGDPGLARAFEPNFGTNDACKTVRGVVASRTGYWKWRLSQPLTLMGLPTIEARIRARGRFGQLAGRLWDLYPDGRTRLVSRGAVRLRSNERGELQFQLSGNAYRFEAGHVLKLEILGRDPNYRRASNRDFSVSIKDLRFTLPVRERSAAPPAVVP